MVSVPPLDDSRHVCFNQGAQISRDCSRTSTPCQIPEFALRLCSQIQDKLRLEVAERDGEVVDVTNAPLDGAGESVRVGFGNAEGVVRKETSAADMVRLQGFMADATTGEGKVELRSRKWIFGDRDGITADLSESVVVHKVAQFAWEAEQVATGLWVDDWGIDARQW